MHRVNKNIINTLILLLLFSSTLFADTELQSSYFVKNSYVLLSDIIKNPRQDKVLYKFNIGKHSKRIKTSELIKRVEQEGYTLHKSNSSYIQFSKKSPINTHKIKQTIAKEYKKIYKNIKIIDIDIHPRSYIESMPNRYDIQLQSRYYLSRKGVVYIKTPDRKKIFFDYHIDSKIIIYTSKKQIKKGEEISDMNTKKESITLDKLRALPLQKLQKSSLEAKHHIKKDTILTQRDVVGLYLVKRGSNINITLKNAGLDISIFAKALQSGRIGQYIYVLTANGKKIKVIVTGRDRAGVQN